jgi:hypothetical protein
MTTAVETTSTLTNPVARAWARVSTQRPAETAVPASTSIPLSFLRCLAADAGLRAELEAAPAATLARFGIRVASQDLPAEVRLPTRRDLENVVLQYASGDDDRYIDPTHFWGFLGVIYA